MQGHKFDLPKVQDIYPIPCWSNHKTPIDNLYLCGSGVHGGGGSQRRGGEECGEGTDLKQAGHAYNVNCLF